MNTPLRVMDAAETACSRCRSLPQERNHTFKATCPAGLRSVVDPGFSFGRVLKNVFHRDIFYYIVVCDL
jgi:hypothetical protein